MPMHSKTRVTLYEEVVNVTHEYFGPAADRFVTRQIRHHLSKNPKELRKKDLGGLINWISMAMALLHEDEELIHKYATDLQALTAEKQK